MDARVGGCVCRGVGEEGKEGFEGRKGGLLGGRWVWLFVGWLGGVGGRGWRGRFGGHGGLVIGVLLYIDEHL